MGIADRLVLHGAQAEALGGVVGRLLEPAVVEHQHLGLAVFEEQFAVVGAFEAAVDQLADADAVEAGAVDEGGGGLSHALSFGCFPIDRRSPLIQEERGPFIGSGTCRAHASADRRQ